MILHSVSLQLVVYEDVARLLDLLDLQASDIYHANLGSESVNLHRHAVRALDHVHERCAAGVDTATVVFFSCPTGASPPQWKRAHRLAKYIRAVLKNLNGYDVSLIHGHTMDVQSVRCSTEQSKTSVSTQWTSTLTFSSSTESFVGMKVNGVKLSKGYSVDVLDRVRKAFQAKGCLIDDIALAIHSGTGRVARVLVIRGALLDASNGLADAATMDLEEIVHPQTDRQAIMRGKLMDRHARYCACIGDEPVTADLINGIGVVIDFQAIPAVNAIRKFIGVVPETQGKLAELNYYFDASKCYIGPHGDSERPDVLGCVIGQTKNLYFQGYRGTRPVGERVIITLNHGDLYIGCDVAFGYQWKRERNRSDIIHYRHAASQTGNRMLKSNAQINCAQDRKQHTRDQKQTESKQRADR
jgi:hypothetical protein